MIAKLSMCDHVSLIEKPLPMSFETLGSSHLINVLHMINTFKPPHWLTILFRAINAIYCSLKISEY